jgi:gas vesicle protein
MRFNSFSGFLIGASAGAVIMLLFAPKAGKETRRYLSRRVDDGKEIIERSAARLHHIGVDLRDKGKKTVKRANKALASVSALL